MFKKIKEWFTKKPESVIEPIKVVPENYNPVRAAIPPLQPETVPPVTNVVFTTTVTSAPTHFEEPVAKTVTEQAPVNQQAVVEAAEGSATAPAKKPRKPRQTKTAKAAWPFPTGKPAEGSTVTQAELKALKVVPAAMKVSKPRKSKAAFVPKQD